MIDHVNIFGKRVSVVHEVPKGGKDAGECYHIDGRVIVSPKQSADNQNDTLLHELLHFVDEEMQTNLRERQVRLLATGIYAMFKANPHLVSQLFGEPIEDTPAGHRNRA